MDWKFWRKKLEAVIEEAPVPDHTTTKAVKNCRVLTFKFFDGSTKVVHECRGDDLTRPEGVRVVKETSHSA